MGENPIGSAAQGGPNSAFICTEVTGASEWKYRKIKHKEGREGREGERNRLCDPVYPGEFKQWTQSYPLDSLVIYRTGRQSAYINNGG